MLQFFATWKNASISLLLPQMLNSYFDFLNVFTPSLNTFNKKSFNSFIFSNSSILAWMLSFTLLFSGISPKCNVGILLCFGLGTQKRRKNVIFYHMIDLLKIFNLKQKIAKKNNLVIKFDIILLNYFQTTIIHYFHFLFYFAFQNIFLPLKKK